MNMQDGEVVTDNFIRNARVVCSFQSQCQNFDLSAGLYITLRDMQFLPRDAL